MQGSSKRIFTLIYLFFDAFAIVLSGFLSMFFRFGFTWDEVYVEYYLFLLVAAVIITILTLFFNKLYDMKHKTWVSQLPLIINSFVYTMVSLGFVLFFIRTFSYSRLVFIYFASLSIILLCIFRYISNTIVKSLLRKGIGTRKLLIAGVNDRTMHIINYIIEHPEFGFVISGVIDKKRIKIKKRNVDFLGGLEDYQEILHSNNISSIIIDLEDKDIIKDIVRYCEENYIQAYMIPDLLDMTSSPVEIGQISTIPLIKFKEGFIYGVKWKFKRSFDIIVSLIALLLLLPLFVITGILIKTTSKGSIFFKHRRMGMNGEVFEVFKFRTMVENAEKILYEMFEESPELEAEYRREYKLKEDPRITGIGRFLRKVSMDELPQLINVLKGEMSIVGPRPIVKDEMTKYGKYAKLILKVPPGLTGMWQMSGRSDLDYEERIKLDMYYINNWSFWLDIMIILKTIPAVLGKKGAY
ncbi:MAG: sugar transferase [Clostridia bacterium]